MGFGVLVGDWNGELELGLYVGEVIIGVDMGDFFGVDVGVLLGVKFGVYLGMLLYVVVGV